MTLIESFICAPEVLDNLLLMDYHYRASNPDSKLLEEPLANIVEKAHKMFQDVFSSLKKAALEPGRDLKLHGALNFKPGLTDFAKQPEANPVNFYEERIVGCKPMLYRDQKDVQKELYVLTRDNVLLNAVHNPLSGYILESSELKNTVRRQLESLQCTTLTTQ